MELQVSKDLTDRLLYSRDMMSGLLLARKAGHKPQLPDSVAWPESVKDIQQILKKASVNDTPVIPFGAGSGVSGGTVPVRGGLMLDLKKLDQLEKIELENGIFVATAQTGILGQHLENQLNQKGFTMGHFPSSILCSTLGGFIACRSAGQLSSKYGKIEDMIVDVEMILPNGTLVPFGGKMATLPGIAPKDIAIGSEGCLGVVTRAKFKIFPLAPFARYRGFIFPRTENALETMREIMQAGLRPAVLRLYDPIDTLLLKHGYSKSESSSKKGSFFDNISSFFGDAPKEIKKELFQKLLSNPRWLQQGVEAIAPQVILVTVFEGDRVLIADQEQQAMDIAKRHKGRDLGEKPGRHWKSHRYSVSYKMPKIFNQDCFVDTIEVATTWDNLMNLYTQMGKALKKKALLLAHFSHAYAEGCSIYFTVVRHGPSREKDCEIYKEIWHEAMMTCLKAGGTISHHHGIGLLKADYLPKELGEGGMDFLRKIKKIIDPRDIMNPGKMGL